MKGVFPYLSFVHLTDFFNLGTREITNKASKMKEDS